MSPGPKYKHLDFHSEMFLGRGEEETVMSKTRPLKYIRKGD